MDLQTIGSIVGIAATVTPLVVWSAIKFRRMCARTRELIRRIDTIYDEITPNGGGSVKDRIEKLVVDVAVLSGGIQFFMSITPKCIFETDAKGACTFANAALCDLFGLSLSQMQGNGWLGALGTQEDRDRTYKIWMTCVENRIPYLDRYRVRNSHSGESYYVRVTAMPVWHPEHPDRPAHYYGTVFKDLDQTDQ